MRGKKGYFFIIDAFIALLILTVGVYIILSSYLDVGDSSQTTLTSKSLMSFMSNMSMANYNSDYKFDNLIRYQYGSSSLNFIRNFENTILEQIGEFYYRESLRTYPQDQDGLPYGVSLSKEFSESIIKDLVPPQYEVQMLLYDPSVGESILLFERNSEPLFPKEDASILIPSKRLIMGDFQDSETGSPVIWGPYVMEVHIWQ